MQKHILQISLLTMRRHHGFSASRNVQSHVYKQMKIYQKSKLVWSAYLQLEKPYCKYSCISQAKKVPVVSFLDSSHPVVS